MKSTFYICPVCGFNGLKEPSYDKDGTPSYEICASCGFEFGFEGEGDAARFRENWIKNGALWFTPGLKPVDWELQKQLENIKPRSGAPMKKKVIARLFIKKGSIEAFKKYAALIIPQTRKEKDCLFYSLFEDIAQPGEFIFYEEYADQEALDVHFNSPYLRTFRDSVSSMQAKEKIVEII